MNKQEISEQQIKELKEQGYKTFEEREKKRNREQALKDYDRHLNCPYG